ncbi:carboxypeptidase B-like [Stegostoma tigrinum]|uniref:carboxypeptidase B-like n=1 Tax=Stegostoma tigrinum TaxID=3053191 RepID=UPI00202B798F|nr:carboxypeptidase B-like [Stegostoma tigrinum]XP_048398141.1 carboxypeptidase B-like [Stegostoma tigrinum]
MARVLFLSFLTTVSVEATVGQHAGGKVFRLKPENKQDLQFLKNVSHTGKVDFWHPHSIDLVTTNWTVDFRVGADWASQVQAGLEKIGLKYDVLIENVQSLMEKQFDQNATDSTGYNYERYHQWNEIESWITKVTIKNPRLISRFEIGQSYEERGIYVLRVGKRTRFMKPAIFMDCGIHAREWISPAFCQWFVKEAVTNYGIDSTMTALLDKLDFLIVPVINVDGYVYSWTKDRFWRKTRSRNSGSNCVGTDPNRNFDARWCTIGASRNPCDETYCGSHAESEMEVKAVANFIRQYRGIKAYITIHSYSQMCLFPYSYTYSLASNYKELNALARNAVKVLSSLHGTQYEYGPASIVIYPSAGGSDDWAYDLGIKYSFTFELRDTGRYGFLLPESQIKPTCEETMLAINYIAAYVLNHPY